MDSIQIFTVASVAMFVPWLLLIFLPNHKWTEPIAMLTALLFMAGAFILIWKSLISAQNDGHFTTFEGVTSLFRTQEMVWAGWLNYLAFSLCAGIWQLNDSREIKLAHLLVVLGLTMTFIAGPLGLLIYLLFRRAKTGKWQVRG